MRLAQSIAWEPKQADMQLYADIMFQQLSALTTLPEGQLMGIVARKDKPGLKLGFNEKATATLSDAALYGVLVHETQHLRAQDVLHMQAYEAKRDWYNGWSGMELFNVARDCQINDLLMRKGYTLPEGGCYGEKTLGRYTADEACEPLMHEIAARFPRPEQEDAPQPDGDLQASDEMGQARPSEGEPGQKGKGKEQEVFIGKKPGKEGAKRTLAASSGPEQARWDSFLAEILDTKKSRETWYRTAKRLSGTPGFADRSYMLPFREPLPRKRAVIAIDVSGSMDAEGVNLLCNLVRNAPVSYDLTVLCFDNELEEWSGFRKGDEMPRRGGGTDFQLVEGWCKAQARYPDAVIILTDGSGDCPEVTKPKLWSWLIYGGDQGAAFSPMRTVDLDKVVRR